MSSFQTNFRRVTNASRAFLSPAPEIMTTFITRCGRQLAADEVFEAWTSGELDRMVQALLLPTHPVDRHFLLMGIVEQSYKLQGLDEMRELCSSWPVARG